MRALTVAIWLSVIMVPVALIALGEHNREAQRLCEAIMTRDVCAQQLR